MCHKSTIFLAPSGASATFPVSGASVSQREARKKSPVGLFFYINALKVPPDKKTSWGKRETV